MEIAGRDQYISRGTTPAEVADTVVYLLSDRSSMITGVDIPICGGSR
ncbi:MAG: SDR family oxidoreductase [Steroidobacteraceae bacterium]